MITEDSPRSRRAVRWLFLLVVVMFGLQLLFVARFQEPYPALMMPGFAGTGQHADGGILIKSVEMVATFSAGEPARFKAPELFAEAPSSHFAVLTRWFSPPAADTPSAGTRASRMAGQTTDWLPGLAARERRHQGEVSPELAAWLRARLETMFAGRQPTRLEFYWYEERCYFAEEGVVRDRSAAGVVTVRFSDEQN